MKKDKKQNIIICLLILILLTVLGNLLLIYSMNEINKKFNNELIKELDEFGEITTGELRLMELDEHDMKYLGKDDMETLICDKNVEKKYIGDKGVWIKLIDGNKPGKCAWLTQKTIEVEK